ncbi:MAG TPA: YcnI family protein [Burkholderiales bacterium]
MSCSLARTGAAVLALACTLAASSAHSHAVLANTSAPAGSFYKAAIGIEHGCSGSATTEVIVQIPPGVHGAKPMPKSGWSIAIERAPLPQPHTMHGHTVTDEVARIRFYGGKLPSDYYDEFTVVGTLPEEAAPLYWKVSQVCEQGRADWDEIPAAGQAAADLKHPALRLEVTPAMGGGHHH